MRRNFELKLWVNFDGWPERTLLICVDSVEKERKIVVCVKRREIIMRGEDFLLDPRDYRALLYFPHTCVYCREIDCDWQETSFPFRLLIGGMLRNRRSLSHDWDTMDTLVSASALSLVECFGVGGVRQLRRNGLWLADLWFPSRLRPLIGEMLRSGRGQWAMVIRIVNDRWFPSRFRPLIGGMLRGGWSQHVTGGLGSSLGEAARTGDWMGIKITLATFK